MYVSAGVLNSSCHACVTGIFPADPSPSPQTVVSEIVDRALWSLF